MNMKTLTITIMATLALAGCGDTETSTEPNWDDVMNGATLKQFIDEDAATKDCPALQDTFDVQQDADVLTYIDNAMRAAGCYS